MIEEIHEGVMEIILEVEHWLKKKFLCQGYYWLTMLADSQGFVITYETCQWYGEMEKSLATQMIPIINPISFPSGVWTNSVLSPLLLGSEIS